MKSWYLSRSPRERVLLIGAVVVAGLILLLQGVLVPGQSAARSASARNSVAIADLAEAKAIAARLRSTQSANSADIIELLSQTATEHGLTVVEQSVVDGVAELRLASDSSLSALSWADAASQHGNAALRTLSISREGEGGVIVDASFSEAGS